MLWQCRPLHTPTEARAFTTNCTNLRCPTLAGVFLQSSQLGRWTSYGTCLFGRHFFSCLTIRMMNVDLVRSRDVESWSNTSWTAPCDAANFQSSFFCLPLSSEESETCWEKNVRLVFTWKFITCQRLHERTPFLLTAYPNMSATPPKMGKMKCQRVSE